MNISLKHTTYTMFKSKDENYFYRFIGIKDKEEYNNQLKMLQNKCSEHIDKVIIFDNEIKLSPEMELMTYIYNELQSMNINHIENEDIVIFDDININNKFLKSLQYVVNLGIANESFFNENVRNNFITKLIVWVYMYVKEINFSEEINPKCIYYGNITRHEVYLLLLLNKMDFDVLYINPLKEEYFEDIDLDNLSTIIKDLQIDSVDTFEERCSKGQISKNTIQSMTKQIEEEIHNELFENTGIYRPWQFRDGYTKSVLLDNILEDIYISYNEPAKVREGFEVDKRTVKVPCFFKKIDGEHLDIFEYQKLVRYCEQSPCTLFFNSGNISRDFKTTDEMYKIMFCQLSDGTFDIEEIKKLDSYRFGKFNVQTQNYLLNKFNEAIKRNDLYVNNLEEEDILKLLVMILELNGNIVKLIDNYDFTDRIPKIVIYLNHEDLISDNMALLLGYLHNLAMDIIIFNPSGMCNISDVINPERFNNTRLQNMNYNSTYKNLMNLKENNKESIFSKLFK